METSSSSMTTLILSHDRTLFHHDNGNGDDDDFDDDDDFGGLVSPKSNCPHIASHVKFQVVDGEMMLLLSPSSSSSSSSSPDNNDCSTKNNKFGNNDNDETVTGILPRRSHHDFHHWLQFNTSTVFTKKASCQHFQCINRRKNNHRKKQYKVDEGMTIMMMTEGEDHNNNQRNCKIDDEDDDDNEIIDNEDEGNEKEEEEEEEEEDNVMGAIGENWLCLECGLLHCSRYQFGHAKMHYETTKERQMQLQLQKLGQHESDKNIIMAAEEEEEEEGGGRGDDRVVEGHCIAVSMADLSVWCYECNSYLRHPKLQEITAHLEGIKFGSSRRSDDDDDDDDDDGNNGAEGGEEDDQEEEDNQEEEEEEEGDEQEEDDDQDEEVIEAKDYKNALADPMLEGDNEESLDTTTISSKELRNHDTHRESSLTSSSASNNSIPKRKGQPPKRRAPETQNHDWSYQKFKPDDGCGNQTSNVRSEINAKEEEEEEDEEIAALIESQHGEMLRAYLARHESFDTSNMGQCVPMHMPSPPSFPNEMADFLRSPLCKSIIVLAGAGMSVSCGIPDFRSAGVGLYDSLRPELLTASAEERELIESDPALALHKHLFLQNPLPMLETKRSFILGTHEKKWKATLAHRFVELLHTKLGKLTRLYTQNIDGLELQTAIPTKKVVNVHGSMGAAACELCGHKMDFDAFCGKVRSNIKDITGEDGDAPPKSTPIYCEACGEATVKPDIVLFAGSLPKKFYKLTVKDLPEADLLIVMGTSLSVAPANSLVYRVPSTALRLVMNNEQVGRRLGIDYSDSAIRDIWAHGSTDASCLDLAEQLGWLDDLALVMDELPEQSARLLRKRLAWRKMEEEKGGV